MSFRPLLKRDSSKSPFLAILSKIAHPITHDFFFLSDIRYPMITISDVRSARRSAS